MAMSLQHQLQLASVYTLPGPIHAEQRECLSQLSKKFTSLGIVSNLFQIY